jgi:hypothetical protein
MYYLRYLRAGRQKVSLGVWQNVWMLSRKIAVDMYVVVVIIHMVVM